MTRNKRLAADITIFFVFFALAALSIIFGSDFVRLTDNRLEITYTLISQIVCMGILPVALFGLLYKKDGSIPRKKSEAGDFLSSFIMGVKESGFAEHISLNKPKKQAVSKVFLIALFMLFINLAVAGINYILIQLFGFKPSNGGGTLYPNAGRLILDLFLVAALPAVFEELTFRGILLGAYKDNPKTGVLLSAFLFALMHMNIQQFLYAFVGGIVMGYVVIKTRSIVSSMIIHFCINAFSTIRAYGYQYPDSIANLLNDLLGAMSFALYAAAAVMAYFMVKTIKNLGEPSLADTTADIGAAIKKRGTIPLKNYAFLAGAVVFGALTTIFSFVWGTLR
ncbi:MAG: CPBP family intramembrane metalloprotease [Clostridiales bacterium]|jgi:membrane protease YdiL (CAAX protease family)|nr:CPBP family intramembrane metalloprotease [Clostridiales bacterium]